jgi:hypothetical protein
MLVNVHLEDVSVGLGPPIAVPADRRSARNDQVI